MEQYVKKLRSALILIWVLAEAGVAKGQDFKQYVGKSPCAADIQSEYSDFGLRLDKIQNLSLVHRYWDKAKIVMIIQPTGDNNHCGVIRDLLQITHPAKNFEFRCFDSQAPTDVIIGTTIRKGKGRVNDVVAIDAWRIDLKEQRFVETRHKVVCSADGWDGEDDGSDMVDEAKKYAAHGKPGQFGPESRH
jgi:hypothetical protein